MTKQEKLDALIDARDRGVLSVSHNGKSVTYASGDELQRTISRLQRELAERRPAVSGLAATRRGF